VESDAREAGDVVSTRLDTLRMVAHFGASGCSENTVHLTYGRTLHDVGRRPLPVTLDVASMGGAPIVHAPGESPLRTETRVAHAQFLAALETNATVGPPTETWLRLYSETIALLPMFDPIAIPPHLTGMLDALSHSSDQVSRAAAHALQRIVAQHSPLRVPLYESLLRHVSRVPMTNPAVLATTLGHLAYLVQIWIDVLSGMDAMQLSSEALLDSVDSRLEAEALVALCHPRASVRLAALYLLRVAASLAETMSACHEHMSDMLTGKAQQRAEARLREQACRADDAARAAVGLSARSVSTLGGREGSRRLGTAG
jgi:hypothetical protein